MVDRTVLITSTYFSSNVAIGSIRMRALAKYLPQHGWTPVVLSPQVPGDTALPRGAVELVEYTDPYAAAKSLLGAKPHESVTAPGGAARAPTVLARAKVRAIEAAKYAFAVPDVFVGWVPFGIAAVRALAKEGRRFDAVLSSSNPKSPHLVGRAAKTILKTPWVADLRDFWTLDHYYTYGWPRKPLEERLERAVLGEANALVTVSDPYARRLAEFLGKPVESILNGFDPVEWPEPAPPLTPEFTITYTGSLALGRRDPTMLFESLRRLADRHAIDLAEVRVRFYGPPSPDVDALAARSGLGDVVRQHGYVPRAEALARQRESQILAILFWNHPLDEGVLTSKLEYLAARRPILALGGPGGAMEALLDETKAGTYVRAGDAERLDAHLLEAYEAWRKTGAVPYRGARERVFGYSHPEMAGRFARVLDSVVSR